MGDDMRLHYLVSVRWVSRQLASPNNSKSGGGPYLQSSKAWTAGCGCCWPTRHRLLCLLQFCCQALVVLLKPVDVALKLQHLGIQLGSLEVSQLLHLQPRMHQDITQQAQHPGGSKQG